MGFRGEGLAGLPLGGSGGHGDAVVHEGERQGADGFAVPGEFERGFAVLLVAERAQVAEGDVFFDAELPEGLDVFGGDGERHALLGFADPDFGVGEAVVFERGGVEGDFGADLLGHFADGGTEAAGAAVADGGEEAAGGVLGAGGDVVAGFEQDVEGLLSR